VVYLGRTEGMDPNKSRYARDTSARTLADIIPKADIFLGLSAGGVLTQEMVKTMARDPIILAMANPMPGNHAGGRARGAARRGHRHRAAPTIRTRSTTSSAFPFIFRGALDSGATTINEAMKLAAVRAIAELTHQEIPRSSPGLRRGRPALRPRLPDPEAVRSAPDRGRRAGGRQAAMDSGVATRPIADMPAYRQRLSQFVYQSGSSMQPLFAAAKRAPKRVVYAEGETSGCCAPRRSSVDEGLARPLLLGRPEVIAQRVSEFGLRLALGKDCDSVNLLDRRSMAKRPTTTSSSSAATACRARGRVEMRSRATLLGGDAGCARARPTRCCAAPSAATRALASCSQRDRPAPGNANTGCDADADAPRAPAVHPGHPRQPRSDCRAGGRDHAAGG
jgi:malate dehydrogenase (oxaloacetate-decarboxylating)(NADP+)